jgi:hypothetical protein
MAHVPRRSSTLLDVKTEFFHSHLVFSNGRNSKCGTLVVKSGNGHAACRAHHANLAQKFTPPNSSGKSIHHVACGARDHCSD